MQRGSRLINGFICTVFNEKEAKTDLRCVILPPSRPPRPPQAVYRRGDAKIQKCIHSPETDTVTL
jgi:hypothetical protein